MLSDEKIQQWAEQAEDYGFRRGVATWEFTNAALARFAALVLEEAAKVCDAIEDGRHPSGERAAGVAWECAAAIRAMKGQP